MVLVLIFISLLFLIPVASMNSAGHKKGAMFLTLIGIVGLITLTILVEQPAIPIGWSLEKTNNLIPVTQNVYVQIKNGRYYYHEKTDEGLKISSSYTEETYINYTTNSSEPYIAKYRATYNIVQRIFHPEIRDKWKYVFYIPNGTLAIEKESVIP